MTVISAANLKWFTSTTGPYRGGAITATEVAPSTMYDAVTGDEAAAGNIEYRGFYFGNRDSNSGGLQGAFAWIDAQTPGADDIAIALGGEGVGGTMEVITNFNTAPAGESFTAPANKAAGLSMGTIPATTGQYPIWTKRNVPAACAAYTANSFVLKVEGDSSA